MLVQHLLLTIFWIVYCALHSLLASETIKEIIKNKFIKYYKLYRPAYVLFAFASLGGILIFHFSFHDYTLFLPSTIVTLIGMVTAACGLILMLICIYKYFIQLSGLQNLLDERPSSILMITGIHKYVRHPLYLGTFIFIWGLFLVFPFAGFLIANIIITLYTLIGIRLEEKKLIAEYGKDYEKYRNDVPQLFPFLKDGR